MWSVLSACRKLARPPEPSKAESLGEGLTLKKVTRPLIWQTRNAANDVAFSCRAHVQYPLELTIATNQRICFACVAQRPGWPIFVNHPLVGSTRLFNYFWGTTPAIFSSVNSGEMICTSDDDDITARPRMLNALETHSIIRTFVGSAWPTTSLSHVELPGTFCCQPKHDDLSSSE